MDSTVQTSGIAHGQLRRLAVTESADDLAALGYRPGAPVGTTQLVPASTGLRAGLQGITELDGLDLLPDTESDPTRAKEPAHGVSHPNGVIAIDHVVVFTPDPDRTQVAFETQGLEARRIRRIETPDGTRRQTFYWLGDVICEVVGPDDGPATAEVGDKPARWWGLAMTVVDLDTTAAFFGDEVTRIKDAVQPGRKVVTLRSAVSSTPTLFISPHPSS